MAAPHGSSRRAGGTGAPGASFGTSRHVADLFRPLLDAPARAYHQLGTWRRRRRDRRFPAAGPGVASDAVAAAARPHRCAEPRERPLQRPNGFVRLPSSSISRAASRRSGSPALRRACCRFSTPSPWPALYTCSCCTHHRLSGSGSCHNRGRSPSRTRCCGRGERTPGHAASRSLPAPHTTDPTYHGGESATDTLLHRLQADVHADAGPPGRPSVDGTDSRVHLSPDDNSVQVHSCHGRARQVEVMRDATLPPHGRRPHARAPGCDRHVSRHRDVRAARPRHLRDRLRRGGGGRHAARAAEPARSAC